MSFSSRLRGRPQRRLLVDAVIVLCLVAIVVGLVFVLITPRESGIKGVVRCATPVASCRLSPSTASVYLMTHNGPFNPWQPPSSSSTFQTDAEGHFQIKLAPGTYWLAAEKAGGGYASEGTQEVIVRPGAITSVTIDLDLHLPL